MKIHLESTNPPVILVVDDNPIIQDQIESILSDGNVVQCVGSGEACLAIVDTLKPNLIIMDIEMGGIDGYETCRRLRAFSDAPVLFLSSHDSIEERISAYDCGGVDFVQKPADCEILKRKTQKIIAVELQKRQLLKAKLHAESQALALLGHAGKIGALFNFMRDRLNVDSYASLASSIAECAQDLGISTIVQIRGNDETVTRSITSAASPIEEEIVSKMMTIGRQFQFKSRWLVNFPRVTILAKDMPEDETKAGEIRDNVTLLAECAESFIGSIEERKAAAQHAETLQVAQLSMSKIRELYREQHVETQVMLTELVSDVERRFITMGLTQRQEEELSEAIRGGTDTILNLFDRGELIDVEFDALLNSIAKINGSQNQNWLF